MASGQRVAVLAPAGSRVLSELRRGEQRRRRPTLVLGPMNAANLDVLRDLLPGCARPGHSAVATAWPRHPGTSGPSRRRRGCPLRPAVHKRVEVRAGGSRRCNLGLLPKVAGVRGDADHLKTPRYSACVRGLHVFTFDPGRRQRPWRGPHDVADLKIPDMRRPPDRLEARAGP